MSTLTRIFEAVPLTFEATKVVKYLVKGVNLFSAIPTLLGDPTST